MRVNAELRPSAGWKEYWESAHLRHQTVLGQHTQHSLDPRETALQALFSQVMVEGFSREIDSQAFIRLTSGTSTGSS